MIAHVFVWAAAPRPDSQKLPCRQRAESVVVRNGDSAGVGPGASREQTDGVTQQWLERGGFAHVGRASTQRQPRFALAETKRAQGSESAALPVRSVW